MSDQIITLAEQGPPGPIAATVSTNAALSALPSSGTTWAAGTIVAQSTSQVYYIYAPQDTQTPDGYFVLAANGGGNWLYLTGRLAIVPATHAGFDNTGVMDNSAVLSVFQTHAVANGSILHFTAGTYQINTAPTWDSRLKILYGPGCKFTGTAAAAFQQKRQPAELVPGYWVDLDGKHGGSDMNSGQSSGSPLRTHAELVVRYGTERPLLDVALIGTQPSWTYLGASSDNTDPIRVIPRVRGNTLLSIIQPLPTPTATVTLSSVTALSRTNSSTCYLQANLGPSAAAQMLAINTTRGNSRGLVFKNVSGNVWSISQIWFPWNPSGTGTFPANYSAGWQNGDTVNLYVLPYLNIAEVAPDVETTGGSTNVPSEFGVLLQYASIYNPQGTPSTPPIFRLGDCVQVVDSIVNRQLILNDSARTTGGPILTNVWLQSGWMSKPSSAELTCATICGGVVNASVRENFMLGVGIYGDTIFTGGETVLNACKSGSIAIDSGAEVDIFQNHSFITDPITVSTPTYGAGNLILRTGRASYVNSAVNTFVCTILFGQTGNNTKGVAYNSSTGALTTPITLSAANMDLAVASGGFGGCTYAQNDLTKCFIQGLGS